MWLRSSAAENNICRVKKHRYTPNPMKHLVANKATPGAVGNVIHSTPQKVWVSSFSFY